MHIFINALILFPPSMNLLLNTFQGRNGKANTLAQQASDYNVTKKYFNIRKPMQTKVGRLVLDAPVRPVSETGLTAQTGLTGDAAAGSDSAKKMIQLSRP